MLGNAFARNWSAFHSFKVVIGNIEPKEMCLNSYVIALKIL